MKRRLLLLLGAGSPVLAQGLPLGVNQESVLQYKLQEGTPGVSDRYNLTFSPLPFPTTSLQILYFSDFTGQLTTKAAVVSGRNAERSYAVKNIDLDTTARALTIQMNRPIPQGESPEVQLEEVRNPSNDGVFQLRGRVLQGGLFPAFFYIGDWFITVGNS
ncbi:DUF2808 domain-containing protein [Candidatus Cyanaurora vandensis]|uniref:DUF2808 domain-containing protein n=1 Tax=Candidatus Cyanaurora vandensis TaxID=2714958 RepID=UPI00257BDA88|nr:DUF2808 domain-containing protein [Candidatus Cyanaurora vandensis]